MTQTAVTPVAASAETPQWTKCPNCSAFVYFKRLQRNLRVCPECNHHFRLSARERLTYLLDDGGVDEISRVVEPVDALRFVDLKPYATRITEAQQSTGHREAAMWGTAKIAGQPVVVAAVEFAFMGGSMGSAVGEVITQAAEEALAQRVPLLVISASGGARMQEGCISLMQMAKTSQAIARLDEEGVLFVSLLTDPTYGGVSASFATLGDVLISEPGALIGFAGRRIIEQTIRQQLPEKFQTAEFLMDHGMLDLVAPRENVRHVLGKLLSMHAQAPVAALAPSTEGQAPITDPSALQARDAWEMVQLARHIDRPNTLEYIGYVFDDFQELHGDRLFAEDAAIVGGLARLGELTVMVVGHQKGHSTTDMVTRNFGMPNPEGYRKALRLLRYAAKFGMPIITFVDTPGAFPGLGAEERGQSVAIARGIMEMSRLGVPIVTVVTGEGGSGGALALAAGDRVLMMQNAYYSVISPEGCSVILWKSAAAAPKAAAALHINSRDLLSLGIVDAVVPEPDGGAHLDAHATAANLKRALTSSLNVLLGQSRQQLLNNRYARFRRFGTLGQQPMLSQLDESA
jgi:acetyl-CoA carboxylase carboxyl transferase alpha subunit/acetyl-CoA carboxylase carboxyl transferase beta subunit